MRSLTNRRLLLAAFISFLAHALFFLVMPYFFPEQTAKKNQMATLELWMKEKKAPIKPESFEDKKPVVELEQRNNETRPDKADYFADVDQSTKKETKSVNNNPLQQAHKEALGAQSEEQDFEPEDSPNDEVNKKFYENDVGRKIHRNSFSRRSKDDPLGIKPKFDRHGFYESTGKKASNDYLPNVLEGNETNLNAWQWRHAPFFNRIKARISQTWAPQNQIYRYDPRGAMLGNKDRVTVMLVTIDRRGFLKDLSITDESGVGYLDEEAERALREAAPFLYPPQELFSGKDEFSFTFAFYLQQNRGFSFDFSW